VKLYVATAFENKEYANSVMKVLTNDGHQITHNWTGESADGLTGEERILFLEKCAVLDAKGVMDSEGVVLLTVEKGGRGMYTEMGIAMATQKPVFVVGPHYNNIFFHTPACQWFDTLEDLRNLLKNEDGVTYDVDPIHLWLEEVH
jgi:hypothetical protein